MPYQVRERLGRGAMGVVDLALADDGRPVALKHLGLHGSAAEMARARQRIRREAEALTQLRHPHIVRLLDLIEDDDEVVLVMPYLAGGTLTDHVRLNGPLQPGQVRVLANSLLDALACAHRTGVVHRDIKPGNVIFDGNGLAYLTDFGIASFRDATSGLTATGAILGTPDFMAPEQARGERATPASDVFALGATLLYALTGQPPYGHCDPRVILQRAAKGRVAAMPPGIDRELRRQLEPMLRRDPRRRPSAAAALAGAGGRPGDGPDGTVVAPATPRPRRPWIAPLAVTLVAVSLILGWLVARRDDGDRAASATGAETPAPSEAPPISACRDLPYQPCGQQPAAGTDGTRCIDDRADYDENVHNGCEARPDSLDGETFDRRLTANLVPADDVDSYPTPVRDNLDLLCDGTFRVSLTAPPGTAMRLEVLAGTNLVDSAVSRDGEAATLTLVEPSCFGDDTGTLTTRVRWVGAARSGESYELTRSGSF